MCALVYKSYYSMSSTHTVTVLQYEVHIYQSAPTSMSHTHTHTSRWVMYTLMSLRSMSIIHKNTLR